MAVSSMNRFFLFQFDSCWKCESRIPFRFNYKSIIVSLYVCVCVCIGDENESDWCVIDRNGTVGWGPIGTTSKGRGEEDIRILL